MENCEFHRELLNLPEYVFPAAMLVFGYPTDQQLTRAKPERVNMKHIVHENKYRKMDKEELQEMFNGRTYQLSFEEYMKRVCSFKYNSDFSKEMTRSVAEYIKKFTD